MSRILKHATDKQTDQCTSFVFTNDYSLPVYIDYLRFLSKGNNTRGVVSIFVEGFELIDCPIHIDSIDLPAVDYPPVKLEHEVALVLIPGQKLIVNVEFKLRNKKNAGWIVIPFGFFETELERYTGNKKQ